MDQVKDFQHGFWVGACMAALGFALVVVITF